MLPGGRTVKRQEANDTSCTKEQSLAMQVVKHWGKLLRKAVPSPSLEAFKTPRAVLSTDLVQFRQGGWTKQPLEVPFSPIFSMMLVCKFKIPTKKQSNMWINRQRYKKREESKVILFVSWILLLFEMVNYFISITRKMSSSWDPFMKCTDIERSLPEQHPSPSHKMCSDFWWHFTEGKPLLRELINSTPCSPGVG